MTTNSATGRPEEHSLDLSRYSYACGLWDQEWTRSTHFSQISYPLEPVVSATFGTDENKINTRSKYE
jgi:hypothetical protein